MRYFSDFIWCGARFWSFHGPGTVRVFLVSTAPNYPVLAPTGSGAWIPGFSEINTKTHLSCIDGDLLKTGKFIYSEKVKHNYTEAESFCSRLGLQVLMPQSIEENDQPEF